MIIRAIFILALSGLLVFSCSSFSNAKSIDEIAEEISGAVVMIIVYDITGTPIGQGSGVFISNEGWILTNSHIFPDAYSAEVISNRDTFPTVTILYCDEVRDLCIIGVPAVNPDIVPYPDSIDLRPGQQVIAIGNPLGLEKTVSNGLISAIRYMETGVELIQTTVPISPGSSGGVLLNEDGELIGITTSSLVSGQNINFAVSINSIDEYFRDFVKLASPYEMMRTLKPAKTSVWYRVVLKWVGNVIGFIIALVFSNALYIAIPIIALAGSILYWLGKGIWWILRKPFRKRITRQESEYRAITGEDVAENGNCANAEEYNVHPNGSSYSPEETDMELTVSNGGTETMSDNDLLNRGYAYYHAEGVERDYALAAECFRKAALLGNAAAQHALGVMYMDGFGVIQDYVRAIELFRKAAAQGYTDSLFNLGNVYDKGLGVPKDHAVAFEWYRKAASLGNARGQFNTAYMYANGEGTPRDYVEAAKLYEMAANQGLHEAQFNLGHLYASGLGLPQDLIKAHMWFNIATSQGFEDAKEARDDIAPQMTSEQIIIAQGLAREWFIKRSNHDCIT